MDPYDGMLVCQNDVSLNPIVWCVVLSYFVLILASPSKYARHVGPDEEAPSCDSMRSQIAVSIL